MDAHRSGLTLASARRAFRRIDPLVRYMLINWALGAAAGVICATALLVADPFGLRPVLSHSDVAVAAIFLLYLGFMTTFGGLVCAAAVMFPPKDDDPPRGGGLRGNVAPAFAFARVPMRRAVSR
jgi:hypothetical protein